MYYFVYALVWLFTLLPLRVLYLCSDFLYPIVYYVVRYRKKVVRRNLTRSFPEKSEYEIRKIERKFYRYFCDLLLETLKEMHLSETEIKKRMTYGNIDGILEQYALGKSVMIMTAHYGNWEWTLGFPMFMPENKASNPIYKKLKNKSTNDLIYALRSKYGAKLIEKNELLRVMFRLKKEEELANFWMISDQSPTRANLHYWTQFLNQDTSFLTGTEQLAVKFNYPVFYADIQRIKRGYYHCEFKPIELEPKLTSEFEITEKYAQLLQQSIEKNPAYWLWSHRRWKHFR